MNATIELSEDEIKKAIIEYVSRRGWKPGNVYLRVSRGCDGGPQWSPDSVSAAVVVTKGDD